MKKYYGLVNTIISILSDRQGFDGWWGNIDIPIQKEIREEIRKLIDDWMKNEQNNQ
jgi:hypothetical protein